MAKFFGLQTEKGESVHWKNKERRFLILSFKKRYWRKKKDSNDLSIRYSKWENLSDIIKQKYRLTK